MGRLDEAILAKAFRGELVPQDETDEPADRLLERIRARPRGGATAEARAAKDDMTTLCDLATKLPELIGALLDRETKLKKGRFREETLTDVFTAALAVFAGPSLIIEYPDEAATGSDLDLDFWHVDSGRRLRLRIQAKRLNGGERNIRYRAYDELLHVVPSTGVCQFETLVNPAEPLLPLYMFYNHASVVEDPYFAGSSPAVRGINLAFAHDIAIELRAKLAAKPKRLHHKRLSHLRPYFFDLATVLCAPADSKEEVPSPYGVFNSLEKILTRRSSGDADPVEQFHPFFKWGFTEDLLLSRDARRMPADGPAVRFNPELERPTITFISGRDEDDRTLEILPQSRSDLIR